MKEILAPVSPAELIDRHTVLHLKSTHITDANRLTMIQKELATLQGIVDDKLMSSDALTILWQTLYRINSDLWAIESDIRTFEARHDFGPGFIALARAFHATNDERSRVKAEINELSQSDGNDGQTCVGVEYSTKH